MMMMMMIIIMRVHEFDLICFLFSFYYCFTNYIQSTTTKILS